jgi:hypothetical protein
VNILLLGEYSGVQVNLKFGLERLGHAVVLASNGDGKRNFPRDINLKPRFMGKLGILEVLLRLCFFRNKFKNFDTVLLIAPLLLPVKLKFLNKALIKFLHRNNGKLFLLAAGSVGTDSFTSSFYRDDFVLSRVYKKIIDQNPIYKIAVESDGWMINHYIHKHISGVIPVMFEYAEGYRRQNYKNLLETIPIPINLRKINYQDNIAKGTVKIFHGVTRSDKGSEVIVEAMNAIYKRYPNEVELRIVSNLSIEEYLEEMQQSNIVLDQTNCYSYGMNAIMAMAFGKVVLGGGRKEMLREMNLVDSPLINIDDDADQIQMHLDRLVCKKEILFELGKKSRKFVEDFHDADLVSKRFALIFERN